MTVYEREAVEAQSGLTSEGMVLVALMSGGDYLPEGVPKCGIRIAAECARAGFGADLCALGEDEQGLREWRERLQWELDTNESGWFRRKHKAIKIPADFPDRTVLGYYTNPVVSNPEAVEKLRKNIKWDRQVDLLRLRETVRHAFEWRGRGGAAKFVRTLAPALLARKLADGGGQTALENIVKGFHGTREHFSTDGLKELRISFVPGEVIVVDMVAEEEDEVEEGSEHEDDDEGSEQGARKVKDYDIFAIERIWVQDLYVRRSLLDMVTAWEQPKAVKGKAKKTAPKTNPKKTKRKEKEKAAEGSILAYLNISKPSSQNIVTLAEKPQEAECGSEVGIWKDMRPAVAGRVSLGPSLDANDRPAVARKPSRTKSVSEDASLPKKKTSESNTKQAKKPTRRQQDESVQGPEEELTNPWSRHRRPFETLGVSPPRGRHFSALGIYGEPLPELSPCPHTDEPYELPEELVSSPSLTRSRSSPPASSKYETILIYSSPGPAATNPTPCVSRPSTPSRGRKSSPIPESPRAITPTRSHTPEKAKTPPSARTSFPQTPTAAFQRLQVIDLPDDTPDGRDVRVNRRLEFSPTQTPLSPNVTIRKKREGRKRRGPQPALRSNDKPSYPTPVPFPLCIPTLRKTTLAVAAGEVRNGKMSKRVVLRESLEGRWEFIEDTWSVREGRKVWEELEVLDLTGDD